MKNLVLTLCVFFSSTAFSQFLKPGQWKGMIHYEQATVPFIFEVGYPNGEVPQITIINGQERRVISDVVVRGDSLTIPINPFDVAISARFSATSMEGVYEKYYRDASFGFSAEFGKPRMMKKSMRPSLPVEERWDMTFSPGESNSSQGVGLFKTMGGKVTGTIMTTVSDYRYFEGIMDGDSIRLSSFDGAHAFMLLGKKEGGKWSGELVFDDGYNEPWVATPDPEAALTDPFELVIVEPGTHKPYYDLLGAGSGKDAIDPTELEGKVVIIQLFGTWCPNSHDETQYLVDWYNKNKEKEVVIIASSYEANYSPEYGLQRLEEYREMNDIPYTLVLGGRLSKASAAMPFPFMQKIEAFPTLVIVDKQGFVRYVHSYFNGPATGSYYTAFDQRFNDIIETLLGE